MKKLKHCLYIIFFLYLMAGILSPIFLLFDHCKMEYCHIVYTRHRQSQIMLEHFFYVNGLIVLIPAQSSFFVLN